MPQGPGEKQKITKKIFHEIKHSHDRKCPQCQRIANSRYFSESKKKYIYKHNRLVKTADGRRKLTTTTYCEAEA